MPVRASAYVSQCIQCLNQLQLRSVLNERSKEDINEGTQTQTDRQTGRSREKERPARSGLSDRGTDRKDVWLFKKRGRGKNYGKKEREMKLMRALGSAGPLNVDG